MVEVTELTNETLRDFVRAHKFDVIHFWAEWNRHDAAMRATIESLANTESDVSFASINVDRPDHRAICHEHGVLNVPFVAYYRDGSCAFTEIGFRSPEEIFAHIERLRAL